jgi:radical SAM-linked protein
VSRVRIRWSKLGKVRWTSHRDTARMWERALRRAGIPVAYSAGFSPHPRISFGLALPTGCESVAEYLDLECTEELLPDLPALSACLPGGVEATAAAMLDRGAASLQESVISCSWRWAIVASEHGPGLSYGELAQRVESLLAAPSFVVGGKDVRAGIISLHLDGAEAPDVQWMEAELGCQPRGLRPAEVTSALGGDLEVRDVCRTHQWMLRDGARVEPLSVGAPPAATHAPRALERAS